MRGLSALARINSDGRRIVVKQNQTAKDIAREMKRAEYNSRKFSKMLRPYFSDGTSMEKCAKVHKFLRDYVKYEKEPASNQTAKTISRFIVDRRGDCKHFATFSVGVLNAVGVPTWFVLVGQRKGNRTPNHAYAQSLVGNRIVTIDPCRVNFNDECKFYYKYNVQPIKD